MNDLSTRIGDWIIAGLIGIVIGALGMSWWDGGHPSIVTRMLVQKVPINVPGPATPPQIVTHVVHDQVACPKGGVQAYNAVAKEKLTQHHALPASVAHDPNQHVLSSSEITSDDHSHLVTDVFDAKTGTVTPYDVREPYAPIAKDFKRELSADLVEKFGGPVARVQIRQDIVQLFGAHVHLMAGGDVPVPIFGMAGKPDAYVGVGVHIPLP